MAKIDDTKSDGKDKLPTVDPEWLRTKYISEGLSTRQIGNILGLDHRTIVRLLHKYDIPTRSKIVKTKGLHTYQDRSWLEHHYLERNLNVIEIAKIADVHPTVITNWLHKHGIPIKRKIRGRNTYKNKAWLQEHYCAKQLSAGQIAQIVGVEPNTIQRWLYHHGIPIRSGSDSLLARFGRLKNDPKTTYRNEQWLRHKYHDEGLSTQAIGDLVGVSNCTIHRWLKKFGIDLRNPGGRSNHVELASEAIEFLEGTLLGDASLSAKSSMSACVQLSSHFYGYAAWFSQQLANWGIEQVGKLSAYDGGYNTDTAGPGYKYYSKHYVELKPLRDKWYPHGVKTVPRDLILTPLVVRQWWIDDGHVDIKRGKPNCTAVFNTNDLSQDDVEWLVKQLNQLGILCHRRPSNNTIGLTVEGTPRLLEYIGPCPKGIQSFYGYKWDRISKRGNAYHQLTLAGIL